MAIHPIDLSTVYQQMDTVAKMTASQNQNIQLSGAINVQQVVQKENEKAKAVQELNKGEGSSSTKIKDDKKQDSSQQGSGARKNTAGQEDGSQSEAVVMRSIKDPRMGQHVDVEI